MEGLSAKFLKFLKDDEITLSNDTLLQKDIKAFSELTNGLNGGKFIQPNDTIQLYAYHGDSGEKKTTTDPNEKLANDIKNQISGSSINSKTISLLKNLNKNNVVEVLNIYNQISPNESMVDAIMNEWGLDMNTVKEYICKPLVEKAKELGINGFYHSSYAKIKDEAELKAFVNRLLGKINSANNLNNSKTNSEANTKQTGMAKQNAAPKSVYGKDGKVLKKINPDDFNLKNIKKQYPSDKYDVQQSQYMALLLLTNQQGV